MAVGVLTAMKAELSQIPPLCVANAVIPARAARFVAAAKSIYTRRACAGAWECIGVHYLARLRLKLTRAGV